jgi:hypothetical protein
LEKPSLIVAKTIYYVGFHYSSLCEALHLNKKNVTPLKIQDVSFLEKLASLKYHIDWEMYCVIKNLIKTELADDDVTSIEDLYAKLKYTRKKF